MTSQPLLLLKSKCNTILMIPFQITFSSKLRFWYLIIWIVVNTPVEFYRKVFWFIIPSQHHKQIIQKLVITLESQPFLLFKSKYNTILMIPFNIIFSSNLRYWYWRKYELLSILLLKTERWLIYFLQKYPPQTTSK